MRFRISAVVFAALLFIGPAQAAVFFHVMGPEAGAWPAILSSVGLRPGPAETAELIVVRPGAAPDPRLAEQWLAAGRQIVLEGQSPLAAHFGFLPSERQVTVRSVLDRRLPDLRIVWEEGLPVPAFALPPEATVFAEERWEGVPLIAGMRKAGGAILWVASSPGVEGYERYPYILHALADLGLQAPFRSKRLAVFFDYSYRIRVDLDYFAALWRQLGVASLQVTAWPFYDADAQRDDYLKRLIEACHRQGISVYAWVELPHVSEKFWDDHPEWREKTALRQDAHLDWRKLMNLQNRDCFREVAKGIEALVNRFDWDGVNMAELYFESLQSYLNPSRFTPLNDDVRREFEAAHGFDPLAIWDKNSPLYYDKSVDGIRPFLNFRADLAKRMQEEWLAEMDRIRKAKPDLDLILTHVDDRFDTQMRDAIGADAARLLPLLTRYDFTFLIEDPATIWHLGPKRYPELARRYAPITPRTDRLAIDINIVERYQDVYPTKKQTGAELFQLVHLAAGAFPQVALYFENSILPVDRDLLPASAAAIAEASRTGAVLTVTAPQGDGVRFPGPAKVNGQPWPYWSGDTVWLPAGTSVVEPAEARPSVRLLDFAGKLEGLTLIDTTLDLLYESSARAIAIVDREPAEVRIDGAPAQPSVLASEDRYTVLLPRGKHSVRLVVADSPSSGSQPAPSGGQ